MKHLFLFITLCSPLAHAEWGRLFFSPSERAVARGELVVSSARPVAESDTLRLDGEISHNGKKMRWLNGELNASSVPAGLKVGQTLSRQTGVKRDVYQAGP